MPQVKRRTPANIVVQHDNGDIESIPLSKQNRLLFDHNLWGLLKDGSEILSLDGDPKVTIIPNDDATEFTLEIEGIQPIHLGSDMKSNLMEALLRVYDNRDDGEVDTTPLVTLRDNIMEDRVRMNVVEYLAEMPPFSEYIKKGDLEVTDSGWLFHGELLLTWEREFRHPNTTSTTRSGSTVKPGSADSAYDVSFGATRKTHKVTIDGEGYQLTSNEMDFMTRAMWAIEVPTPS